MMAGKPPEVEAVVSLAYGDNRVWEEVLDGVTGQKSYFCMSTKEIRRTKPPGFDAQVASRAAKLEKQRQDLIKAAGSLGLKEEPKVEDVPLVSAALSRT